MSDNDDQAVYWNEIAGAKWVGNQARLDRVFAPLTAALIAAAAPQPGERVLDVGCGCGETTLLVAARVGAGGNVLAVDLSKPMLDHAATRPVPTGASPIRWLRADAMTWAFPLEADLMISRFGVMFFRDPTAALRNLRRGLKPGGRVAFITWRSRPEVEWMQWPLDQVAPVLPVGEATMGEPGPFGFADAEATRAILTRAGYRQVEVASVDASVVIGAGPDPVDDAMTLLLDTGPVAVLFRESEPDDRKCAENLLREGLEKRIMDGAIRLDAGCWLYSGVADDRPTR